MSCYCGTVEVWWEMPDILRGRLGCTGHNMRSASQKYKYPFIQQDIVATYIFLNSLMRLHRTSDIMATSLSITVQLGKLQM